MHKPPESNHVFFSAEICVGKVLTGLCALTLSTSSLAQFETRGSYVADAASVPSAIAVAVISITTAFSIWRW